MGAPKQYPDIAVVFRTPRGRKDRLKVFKDLRCPDTIITNRSKLLPENSEIVEIGVGNQFEQKYKKKYKL